jgi:hypothetical protein
MHITINNHSISTILLVALILLVLFFLLPHKHFILHILLVYALVRHSLCNQYWRIRPLQLPLVVVTLAGVVELVAVLGELLSLITLNQALVMNCLILVLLTRTTQTSLLAAVPGLLFVEWEDPAPVHLQQVVQASSNLGEKFPALSPHN